MNLEELKVVLSLLYGGGILLFGVLVLLGYVEEVSGWIIYSVLAGVCVYHLLMVGTLAGRGALGCGTVLFPATAGVFFFTLYRPASWLLLGATLASGVVDWLKNTYEENKKEALEEATFWIPKPDYGSPSNLTAVYDDPDDKILLLAYSGGRLDCISTADEKRTGHIETVDEIPFCLVANRSESLVATISGDSRLRVWNLETGVLRRELLQLPSLGNHLAISPDGFRLAISSNDGTLYLWNAHDEEEPEVPDFLPDDIWQAEFVGGPNRLAVSCDETAIWNLSGETREVQFEEVGAGTELYPSPDGNVLLGQYFERDLVAWDTTTGERIWKSKAHDMVYDVAISPDSRWAVAVGVSPVISVFRLSDGNRSKHRFGGQGHYNKAVFHPNNRTLYLMATSRYLKTRLEQ